MTIYVLVIVALLIDGTVVADAFIDRPLSFEQCVEAHDQVSKMIQRDKARAHIADFTLRCEPINLTAPKLKPGEKQT
jgi:hypothetical protein